MIEFNENTPVLSFWNPWLEFMLLGLKDIENRDWKPPQSLIGKPLLLHATQKFDPDWVSTADKSRLSPTELNHFGIVGKVPELVADYPHGGICGIAIVRGFVSQSDSKWFFGRYGWQLDPIERLPFTPCKGSQGFWHAPKEILQSLPGYSRLPVIQSEPANPTETGQMNLF